MTYFTLAPPPQWPVVPIPMYIPVRVTGRSIRPSPILSMSKNTSNLCNLTPTTTVSTCKKYVPLKTVLFDNCSAINKAFVLIVLLLMILKPHSAEGLNHSYRQCSWYSTIQQRILTVVAQSHIFGLSRCCWTPYWTVYNKILKQEFIQTKQKQECKGSICHWLKRLKDKLLLPTVLLINVQSLKRFDTHEGSGC